MWQTSFHKKQEAEFLSEIGIYEQLYITQKKGNKNYEYFI